MRLHFSLKTSVILLLIASIGHGYTSEQKSQVKGIGHESSHPRPQRGLASLAPKPRDMYMQTQVIQNQMRKNQSQSAANRQIPQGAPNAFIMKDRSGTNANPFSTLPMYQTGAAAVQIR